MNRTVDIRPLKIKATSWPEPARTLILSETNQMLFDDFIVKMGVWERLLLLQKGEIK